MAKEEVTYCAFRTTQPEVAMRQSARHGSQTRYKRCRNRATTSVLVSENSLTHGTREREVQCCGLHKRLYEERGWRP